MNLTHVSSVRSSPRRFTFPLEMDGLRWENPHQLAAFYPDSHSQNSLAAANNWGQTAIIQQLPGPRFSTEVGDYANVA